MIKVLDDLGSGGNTLLGLIMASFPSCPYVAFPGVISCMGMNLNWLTLSPSFPCCLTLFLLRLHLQM